MRWLAINVDAFRNYGNDAWESVKAFLQNGRMLLIEDESSRIKNHKAGRTRALIGYTERKKRYPGLAEYAASRMILTGTPITIAIEDLWCWPMRRPIQRVRKRKTASFPQKLKSKAGWRLRGMLPYATTRNTTGCSVTSKRRASRRR